jgi:TRAP-type C4-dicarboxylate transport system permease small subunit
MPDRHPAKNDMPDRRPAKNNNGARGGAMATASSSERLIGRVEGCAAAALMFITALTFTSVFTRYVIVAPIPDAFDISRLMMGIMISWGIATCGYRDDHIQMDVLWSILGVRGKRLLDLFATSASLFFMALFTWTLARRVWIIYTTGEKTYDVGLPIWPFYAVAWIGIAMAMILLVVRLWALIRRREIARTSPEELL